MPSRWDKKANSLSSDTSDSEHTYPVNREITNRLRLQTENVDRLQEQEPRHKDTRQLHTLTVHHDNLPRSQSGVWNDQQGEGEPRQYSHLVNPPGNYSDTLHHRTPSYDLSNLQNPELAEHCPYLKALHNQSTPSNTFGYDSPFNSISNSLNSNHQKWEFQYRLLQKDQGVSNESRRNGSRSGQEGQFLRCICFDMRKVNKIGYGDVRRFPSSKSTLTKETVADILQLPESEFRILENTRVSTGEPSRYIIIIAQNAQTSTEFILVDSFVNVDKEYPEILCLRIPVKGTTASQIAYDIAREMSVKMVVICEYCQLLGNETLIRNDVTCRRLEAVQTTKLSVKLVHRPSQNVESRFKLESNTGNDIGQLRQACQQTITEHTAFREEHVIHFTFNGQILKDTHCIGIISWRKRYVELEILIASHRAIGATLNLNEAISKDSLQPRRRTIAIEPLYSTAYLRHEISKHTGNDPKAVKVTLNGRRVEEMSSLEELGDDLVNGCALNAGIKKKKTIRVRDSVTNREESFSLYMLETVGVLKEMIARVFEIEPLQISLTYKRRTMSSSELLVNYPVKNRTEVIMEVFSNRANVRVYIAFKKIWTVLTVDNITRSTVDDLVRFCALTFQFDRRCARVRYYDRCLSRFSSFAEEKIRNNDSLILVYFDQPAKLDGGLILVYTVRPDGQINPRVGAVSGGILLHASKKVKPESSSRHANIGEQIPGGIFVCEDQKIAESLTKPSKNIPNIKEGKGRDLLTISERNALRKRFIKKARKAKMNAIKTYRREFADRPMWIQHTDSQYPQSGQESSDSETDLKTILSPEDNSRSTPEDDGTSLDNNVEHADIPEPNYSPVTHKNPGPSNGTVQIAGNPVSYIAEEQSKVRGILAFGETSGSASDCYQTGGRQVEFELDTESSDDDNKYQVVRHNRATGQLPMTYLGTTGRIPRRRTRTEGDIVQFGRHEMVIHRIETFPTSLQTHDRNNWLNISGLPIQILFNVGRKVGRQWRRLARHLGVPQEDIENIEDRRSDLHEKAFDCLILWKKSKGSRASKEALLEGLRAIDMTAVAEFVEELCENLQQTV